MIDPIKILQRAWRILWSYRALWVFGLILALAAGGSSGNGGGNNGAQYQNDGNNGPQVQPPANPQQAWEQFKHEMQKLFDQGIPEFHISGQALTTFLWVIVGFIVFMIIVGIIMAIARYVSETAVIRMVDEYENSGNKMTLREGFRIGWSRTAWRLFLINLIVNLPVISLMLILIMAGVAIFFAVTSGNVTFAAASVVTMVVLAFLAIFAVIILSIILGLFRPFFWRACALEGLGVTESLRRGFAMVRENWKSAGLMWLVMIGLGIAWAVVSLIAAIITLPLVIVTAGVAVLVAAIPGLLLFGIFSTFLSAPLSWIAAALFILPLFFVIAFFPWVVLGSWQKIYTSSVWTLTYREIKALPALPTVADIQPVGD